MKITFTFLMLAVCCHLFSRGAAADVQLDVSTQGGDACPGETITFTCIGTNLTVIQTWNIDGEEIVAFTSGTNLGTSSRDVSTSVGVVMFMLDLLENTVVSSALRNFTSILNVTATPELNGHTITCGDDSVQMSEPINVAVPPSSPQSLQPVSYTCDSAVIGWGPPEDEGGGIVSFTCTISGPGDSSVTVPNCNSPFTIDNITVNTDYTVSVTATNCAGVNTSTIPIRIDGKATDPPENLTIQLDCSVNLELTVTWMNSTVSMLPSTSLPLVCPIEEVICRINGTEIECDLALGSFTRSVTDGMYDIEVMFRNDVGESNSSTASIEAFVLRAVSVDDRDCATAVNVTLNDECQGELGEFEGLLTYGEQSDSFSFMTNYTRQLMINGAGGTMYNYNVTVTQNGVLVGTETGNLTYGVPAPFVPPPTVCQRDDGVPATGCVNPSLPLTGNCTCPDSFVMITFDEGQWKPNPPCGDGGGGDDGDDDGSDDGAIIGIAVGASVGGVVIIIAVSGSGVLIWILCFKRDPENNKKKKKPDEEEIDLHERGRPSPDPVDNLPTYADPHEIKREEFPGTEDVYTMPDKKKKTRKPEDHLPTYADPSAIEHETAPTGDLYTVVDKPKRSSRKQPPPPPEGALQTYAEVDVGKKQRGRELNYSDIQMTGTGDVPTRQPGVIYSDVAPHQHH